MGWGIVWLYTAEMCVQSRLRTFHTDRGGYRLSSALLGLGQDLKISEIDHRGAQNHCSDPRAGAALRAFVLKLNDPEIKKCWENESRQQNLIWPAAGSEDTELSVNMEPEVDQWNEGSLRASSSLRPSN
jgi:hypothetical protein